MEPEQTWAGVEEVIEHPDYDGDILNDIAVIRLAQEVSKSSIHKTNNISLLPQVDLSLFSPVCIPASSVGSR